MTHDLEVSEAIPVREKPVLQTVHLSAAAVVQPSQLTEQSVQALPDTENFAAPQGAQAAPTADPELATQGAQDDPVADPELAGQSVHWVVAVAPVPTNCLFAGQFVQTVGDAVLEVPAAWKVLAGQATQSLTVPDR